MIRLRRRQLILGSAALAAGSVNTALAHNDAGVVTPPRAPPALSLELDDGAKSALAGVLGGKVTALQLIFTSCQSACPIQGAIFAEVSKKLGERLKSAQLLSISIDPDRDTPPKLRDWLNGFGATAGWRAARPEKARLSALTEFLKSEKAGPDPHTPQVYFFNRKGELAMRSVDFPAPPSILKSIDELIAQKA